MLWEREPNDAVYVDTFAFRCKHILDEFYRNARANSMAKNLTWNKSDSVALEKRKEGNESFAQRRWISAMDFYSESLSYAEHGAEHIGLAYANRSACFFHEQKYKECLVDIELARKNGYPAHLMFKLDRREEDCRKRIEDGQEEKDDFFLKLSYEPDSNFPCMANVLEIDQNSKGDLVLKAKEDIDVGKIVIVDKAYTSYLYSRFGWRCSICLKNDTNLIPCKKCTTAMFCSDECRSDPLHEDECGLQFSANPQTNGMMMNEVRSMIKAINIFPNVVEMVKFVEAAVQSDPKEIPKSFADERSKYRAFLKLHYPKLNANNGEYAFANYGIYRMLMEIPKVKAMFNTKKYQRFLMHLILHHYGITEFNSIRMRLPSLNPNPTNRRDVCSQVGLLRPYFRHSCAPNIFNADRDGHGVYITTLPIKKGEKLLFLLADFLTLPKPERQKVLSTRNFLCTCIRCVGPWATPEQRKRLLSDPLYKNLGHNFCECATILQKYGGTPWCEDLAPILAQLRFHLMDRLAGPTTIERWASIMKESFN